MHQYKNAKELLSPLKKVKTLVLALFHTNLSIRDGYLEKLRKQKPRPQVNGVIVAEGGKTLLYPSRTTC